MIRFVVFAFLTLLSASVFPAHAQVSADAVETEHASSVLVSEKAGIMPGETIHVGLYQALQENWHVYWQNPGDSGLPLTLKWTLPDGWTAGEIKYPVPHQLPVPPLMNYGHEGEPVFLVPMTASADAVVGSTETLTVKAGWLICEEVCVPENATLSISIPVVADPAGIDPAGGDLVENALAVLPIDAPFEAGTFDYKGAPALVLETAELEQGILHFFPFAEGLIEPSGKVSLAHSTENHSVLFFESGFEYAPENLTDLSGVLTVLNDEGEVNAAYNLSAPLKNYESMLWSADEVKNKEESTSDVAQQANPQSLLTVLGLALLGGLILNIMPCVFPIIFLKAGALAQSAQHDLGTVRRHGLLYTAGVVLAFLAIAGVLLALRAGGESLGWGFQLQHPLPVSIFAIVMMLIGLNLAGVFEMGTSVQGVGGELAGKGGNAGAFFTGLLAVAVAAPCVGPFLGGALSFALNAPGVTGLAVFGVMGLGLALPYLLISFVPALAKILPRPGAWMQTFKQFLAFPMFATVIWLVWTLTRMSGTNGLVMLLSAMLLVAFGAWMFGRSQSGGGFFSKLIALATLVGAGFMINSIAIAPVQAVMVNAPGSDVTKLPSDVYSAARLQELRDAGTPVFVDFTASWCVTCQSNKITAIKRANVIAKFHETGTVYMVADWTVQDPEITKALESFGRSGVPLYVYYGSGAAEPIILPQVLTPDLMVKTLGNI